MHGIDYGMNPSFCCVFKLFLEILPIFISFDAHVNEIFVVFALCALKKIETSFTDVHVSENIALKEVNGQLKNTLNSKRFEDMQII